jgi:hypothetical protein
MNALQLFADLVRAVVDILEQGDELPLEQRVRALATLLPQLYAAGATFAVASVPVERPPPRPAASFGRLDAFERDGQQLSMSAELGQIHAWLAEGLVRLHASRRDADQAALDWWSGGFDHEWGARLVLVLPAVHRALSVFRADALERARPRRGLVMPDTTLLAGEVTARPRAVLGIRFEPGVGGAEVVAIHPRGPAGGVLLPGDLLLSVDHHSLDGLTSEAVGALLQGAVGRQKRFEVYRDGETLIADLAPIPPEALEPPRFQLKILHPAGASRATAALRVLGCLVRLEGGQMTVVPSPEVNPSDVGQLLAAGEAAGIWVKV